jgi:hypothetical protein
MRKERVLLASGICISVFALSLCFVGYVVPDKRTPNSSGVDRRKQPEPSLSTRPPDHPPTAGADIAPKTSTGNLSSSPDIAADNDRGYGLKSEPRSLDEIETFLSEVHKPMVLQPGSPMSRLKGTESEEVRALLDSSRRNYEQIQNIRATFSAQMDGNTYSLEGEIVARSLSGKYNYMTVDMTTSSGRRLVQIYANGIVLAGQGDREESVGLAVSDRSELPADPMFCDVLWREYRLVENDDNRSDRNAACLQSGPYTLWIDRNTKSILRYKLQVGEGISREVIMTKCKPYSDGLYYPEEMVVNETLDGQAHKFTYAVTDVVINPDADATKEVTPLPKTHYRIGNM